MVDFKNMQYEEYPSLASFIDSITTREVNEGWRGHNRESRDRGDEKWYGTASWQGAVDLANYGYQEAVDKIKANIDSITKEVNKRVQPRSARPKSSVVGSCPNVPRAIMGLPRDMRDMEKRDKKVPGITINYCVSANCGVKGDTLFDCGAGMVALVKLLERAQVPTRIIVSTVAKYEDNGPAEMSVVIKDYHNSFNMKKIGFCIGHPSFMRRLYFAWIETAPFIKRHVYGYGTPLTNYSSDIADIKEHYLKDNVYWFCYKDFENGADDVIKAWDKITDKNQK